MKRATLIFAGLAACALLAFLGRDLVSGSPSDPGSCAIVTQAVADYSKLRTGSLRKDVEKTFELDDGLQFTFSSRYVYKKCAYVHVNIEFKSRPAQRNRPATRS